MRWGLAVVFVVGCSDPPPRAPVAEPPPPAPAPVATVEATPAPPEPAPAPEETHFPDYKPLPDQVYVPPPPPPPPPGWKPTDPPVDDYPKASKAEMAACAARGGKIEPTCMSGDLKCVLRFRDAGKKCSDKKDCFGRCIYPLDNPPAPLDHAIGRCEPTNDPCGCSAEVRNGHVGPAWCVD